MLLHSLVSSATAEEIEVTVNVEANECAETVPSWNPFVIGGNSLSATVGQAALFQVDPDFTFGDGFIDGFCGTPIAPSGLVGTSIAVTGNPDGWDTSIECTETCPTADFLYDQQGLNFIDASVTPPNVIGAAYQQGVVVTLTWTP